MSFKKEIFDLAMFAAQGKGYVANSETYSVNDVEASLKEELKKFVGSRYDFERNKLDLYELIALTADQIVPARIESILGQFAEIVNLPQGGRATFKKKLGRLRAKQFVGRVSPAGIYETFRLDDTQFEIYTHAIGGGIRIDFERYLDGREDWSELLDIITTGLENAVYSEIAIELAGSYAAAGRPANTFHTHAGFESSSMRAIVDIVRTYGKGAIIFATPLFIASMGDYVVYANGQNPSVSVTDIEEMRRTGRLSMFYGAPIVEIPNTFEDETNATYQLSNQYAFILPIGGEKLVKVVFEGDTYINDLGTLPGDYSMELMVYKKLGTALLYTNNWGIFQNSTL